jgi:drug/metabolite transporter (DMT)-like permease
MNSARGLLWPSVPLALGSAVLFGASTPISKLLLGADVNPWLLAGILYIGAGVGLAAVRVANRLTHRNATEAPLRWADLPWLVGVLIFGGGLGPLLLMLGLSMTSASSGSLLLNVEGLATMVFAWVVFRENVDRRLLLGALAILGGATILSFSGAGLSIDIGGLLIIGACGCWGIDNNLARRLSGSDPTEIAMYKGLVAGGVNLVPALLSGAHWPSTALVAAGAVNGFLGVGVSLVMFMLALRHLGAARTGAYFSLAPFIGAVLALVLLREPVTLQLIAAGLLMSVGLYLHLSERHEHPHRHAAIEHEHSHVHDEHHQHAHDGPVAEPHTHWHRHEPLRHSHPHYPDLHHRHSH